MAALVSTLFANSFNTISAGVTRKFTMNLDETAACSLALRHYFARHYTNKADAYNLIFTTSKEVTKIPLSHFIPEPMTQFQEGIEIDFLIYDEPAPPWLMEGVMGASKAMNCTADQALVAMINAMTHSVTIGSSLDFE